MSEEEKSGSKEKPQTKRTQKTEGRPKSIKAGEASLQPNTQNPPEDRLKVTKVFNKTVIKRGILLFVGITILSLTGIFLYTNTGKTLEIWKSIDWIYILLGFVFIFNDLFIGGFRNHIFAREFIPGISQMVCIKANLANIFMGAVTPSQSGGGPAQWYILYRNGLTFTDILGISFYNWISTIVFFPLTGLMALYILKDNAPDGLVMHLTKFGFSIFTTLFVVIFLALFAPNLISFVIKSIAKLIGLVRQKWGEKLSTAGDKGMATLSDYRGKYLGLIQRKPWLMLYSFVLTIVLYFNKYLLAYVFVMAFGIDADFWTVISIQAVVYLLLYFAPSPGGSGLAELSISALMVGIIGQDYIASFTLLYRSFLVFIPALLGSYVVLRQISKE